MKLQIGQEIVIKEDFNITGLMDDTIQVKTGDKGYIDSNGFIHYETGKARGKIQKIAGAELEGYDTENIAKLIYEQLKWKWNIDEHLENYDNDKQQLIDDIDYFLSEIF